MSRSAVTTSAATRLSQESPAFFVSQPMPPPSVSPAMPVWLMNPPGVASPCAWVAASTSAQVAPPPHTARRAAGSTGDAVHRAEMDHQTAFADRVAGVVVPAAADRDLEPARTGEPDRIRDLLGGCQHAMTTAGLRSIAPFHTARDRRSRGRPASMPVHRSAP